MEKRKYRDYIYIVEGEELQQSPDAMFNQASVYLIIDIPLEVIWIWAGKDSRLFHRYVATNLVDSLKEENGISHFQNEIIREGLEPVDFMAVKMEINHGEYDLPHPGKSRKVKNTPEITGNHGNPGKVNASNGKNKQILKILSEIKEMHQHVQYSLQHVEKRILKIEKMLGKTK